MRKTLTSGEKDWMDGLLLGLIKALCDDLIDLLPEHPKTRRWRVISEKCFRLHNKIHQAPHTFVVGDFMIPRSDDELARMNDAATS